MSQRQHNRGSRFTADIETSVRVVAVAFRDNDVEQSTAAVVHLWWNSGLRGRHFSKPAKLPKHASPRVSSNVVDPANVKRCRTS